MQIAWALPPARKNGFTFSVNPFFFRVDNTSHPLAGPLSWSPSNSGSAGMASIVLSNAIESWRLAPVTVFYIIRRRQREINATKIST